MIVEPWRSRARIEDKYFGYFEKERALLFGLLLANETNTSTYPF